ncbi:MAG TPA: NADH-quinone oxidoreductase subunit A [Acidimicrobiia bacterium]|jgi:NADH-quinone oxidoreductase subunit A
MTLADYLPIVLMAALGVGFAAVSLWMSWRLAPNNPTPEKLAPYECGIVPLQDPVERFPVKFYLVAMLFVIFDVEIVFLFAWAVRFEQLAWAGVAAMAVFVALLVETLVYVWKRGALDWNVARRGRYRQVVADGAGEPGTSTGGARPGVGEAA